MAGGVTSLVALAAAVDAEVRHEALAALSGLEDIAAHKYRCYTSDEPSAIAFLQTAHNASVSNTPLEMV